MLSFAFNLCLVTTPNQCIAQLPGHLASAMIGLPFEAAVRCRHCRRAMHLHSAGGRLTINGRRALYFHLRPENALGCIELGEPDQSCGVGS